MDRASNATLFKFLGAQEEAKINVEAKSASSPHASQTEMHVPQNSKHEDRSSQHEPQLLQQMHDANLHENSSSPPACIETASTVPLPSTKVPKCTPSPKKPYKKQRKAQPCQCRMCATVTKVNTIPPKYLRKEKLPLPNNHETNCVIRRRLRIAMINDGKLSAARSLILSDWMLSRNIDICFISEAAHPSKYELTTLGEYKWAAPLLQRKGGSGFLLRKELLGSSKINLHQSKDLNWSIATWKLSPTYHLISTYITPEASRDIIQLSQLLSKITEITTESPTCIIAGDFNLPHGEPARKYLDRWANSNGLKLNNEGMKTHWMKEDSPGTDIDLCFTRGINCTITNVESPATGHARIIMECNEGVSIERIATTEKINWSRLSNPETQKSFQEQVEKLCKTGVPLEDAIIHAGCEHVGFLEHGNRNRLPRSARKKVRRLRRQAKIYERGSPEYLARVLEIGAILRRFRIKAWKRKVRKLCETSSISDETWAIINRLRKSFSTSHAIGISDKDIATTYKEIYGSNMTHRPDWEPMTEKFSIPRDTKERMEENPTRMSTRRLDKKFTTKEIIEAIKALPRKKAPGIDGITAEVLKSLQNSKTVIKSLKTSFNEMLKNGYKHTTEGRLVAIPKKEAPTTPLDMRPLMMLPTTRKILEKTIANRLHKLARINKSDGIHHTQGGFRHDMSINRQLLLTQLTYHDAQETRQNVHITSLDMIKAFDRIPRAFAAHCATNYLGEFCPKLANLVADLTLSKMEAHIGKEKLPILTGVPQGGILSPWLFTMAMDDLAKRIGDEGHMTSKETTLGTLLYADDILLMDTDITSRNSRLRLINSWLTEWGGALNESKTQKLSWINNPLLHDTKEDDTTTQTAPINYLGMHITKQGIKCSVPCEEMLRCAGSVTALSKADSLSPRIMLQIARSIGWTRVSTGMEIALPDPTPYVRMWHRVARHILNTFKCTHGVEIQREMGLLYHPVYWICKLIIKQYGKIYTEKKDMFLLQTLQEHTHATHPLVQRIEELLAPTGITWKDLQNCKINDNLRKAKSRIREWTYIQIQTEGRRLNIHDANNTKWTKISDGPAKYLAENNARYGFIFRLCRLGPSNTTTEACYFCKSPDSDTGTHCLRCDAARAKIPLPTELQTLLPEEQQKALDLHNDCENDILRATLRYCKQLWEERRKIRETMKEPTLTTLHYTHNPDFMRPSDLRTAQRALQEIKNQPRTTPAPIRRTPPQTTRIKRTRTHNGSRTYITGRWTKDEETLLTAAVKELGTGDNIALSNYVGTRTALQCSDKLRTKAFSSLRDNNCTESSKKIRRGRWTPAELSQLSTGAAQLEGHWNPNALANAIGTRTARQINERIKRTLTQEPKNNKRQKSTTESAKAA